MQFLYPAFLWALSALAIPIIIHLFYFRRYKKVYFSNLRFLREVKEETSARNRLRNLLILLARLLAMAFIILAFAQPVIPLQDAMKAGIRNVSIFVDNSFSMQSFGKDLSLFDRSKQKAHEIIMGYGAEDRFQVVGHELSPSQTQWISREEAQVRLEELDYTPVVKPLSVVANRQKQTFAKEEGNPVSWMISDFQESIFDLSATDSTYITNLLPMVGVQEKNVAIDSAWFESPVQTLNQTSALYFSIHNYAPEDADNIRVTIAIDGQERPEGTLDIGGGQIKIDTAMITVLNTGWHSVVIRISDFPVTFDDSYYMSFQVAEHLNILSINQSAQNDRMVAVFSDAENFVYENATSSNIPYARFQEYNLIILNELTAIPSGLVAGLKKFTEEGGNVFFIPSGTGTPEQYNALLTSFNAHTFLPWKQQERQAGKINTDAFVFKDVFKRTSPNMRLPKVTASFPYAASGSKGQSLVSFRDGGDLISFYPSGKGSFSVMSTSLDEKINDLALQPEIFVPLLYKLTLYSADFPRMAYTIGVDHLIPVDKTLLRLDKETLVKGPAEFIPGLSPMGSSLLVDVQGQVRSSGVYEIIQEEKLAALLAFNYDRKESDLSVYDMSTLQDSTSFKVWEEPEETNLTQLIESSNQGKQLWKWCLILGLFFIAMEIALIRLWKNG